MKVLYLECSLGVSGDMLLAALAGVQNDPEEAFGELEQLLAGLPVEGLRIQLGKQMISSIQTWKVGVQCTGKQPLRTLNDIKKILDVIGHDNHLGDCAMRTMELIAEAESRVHGVSRDQVHFHEIGALDTIADVLGVHFLARRLGARKCIASPVNLGSGTVTFSHGTFPVPAPACAELAKGMPVFVSDLGMEAATPTGMALVRSMANEYGPLPLGFVERVGYGSGDRSSDECPTFVRAFLLEEDNPQEWYLGGCPD
ncbi:MAG: LarC family nickel insertion protein [Proteobacteria bacterium]|nr:LarC family nickel insertion protein [Pseudomonadota bacterium]MBU1611407.1 LarC family nickel insertion protein [Pseudomonadota bacterium]